MASPGGGSPLSASLSAALSAAVADAPCGSVHQPHANAQLGCEAVAKDGDAPVADCTAY